ncbi:uncharacterized protein SPSK_01134 [Sporothrix schenckii 1099-18]|uniref:Magnesium chelatase n=1 Tax=Sporothrix schenckii 1099-18 TaxID=1397361 RepID=A0A0F2LWI0_SPOSC|nr:uncharacterized protein SPSK_01134 [Sporothrix schenckii 1099-18]KJR81189.1 hypothetical protein SPSK_01134 [Sporothrix schenckii 1099-18]
MEEGHDIVDRVQRLSDLELAMLLSLISHEHCVIGTPETAMDSLVDELRLISRSIFGLHCTVVDCQSGTTLEDFITPLLLSTTSSSFKNYSDIGNTGRTSHINGTSAHQHNGDSSADFSRLFPMAPRLPEPSSRRASQPVTSNLAAPDISTSASATTATTPAGTSSIADVLIAKNLNMAPEAVQIQTLELLRTRRIFAATAMQAAPRPFLLVAVVAANRGFRWGGADDVAKKHTSKKDTAPKVAPYMTAHLNDFFSMGHWHDPDHGYPNLEEQGADANSKPRGEENSDSESLVKQSVSSRAQRGRGNTAILSSLGPTPGMSDAPMTYTAFSDADIDHLTTLSKHVRVDTEVLRYQLNVVAFLRMHRAVAVMGPSISGLSCVSPRATKQFENLARCLAPLHRLDYISPALVSLAARKTYLHRIRTISVGHSSSRHPMHERSMQWGSEKAVVKAILEEMSPEDVIDDVLGSVVPPL